ncbi:DUF2087 domain-containing protein [Aquabacter cavernae]|uniref:DUF2087 domain-containing protein n=1 Tax=Aquabacter cavernae TaxID=2496029 RepID=UPI000F8C7887|nr:DUF2087 domain-containing protein [Aquabacter cavernae]
MSRQTLSFETKDLSAFARALGRELARAEGAPGHLALLNMLARAGGFRNYQHLRQDAEAHDRLEAVPSAPAPVDHRRVERVCRHFDAQGRLVRWPGKASERTLCIWALWARLPTRETLSEKAVNAALNEQHLFADPALLRRIMCDDGLMWRTRDGRAYRRLEAAPPPEAVALIRALRLRSPARGG